MTWQTHLFEQATHQQHLEVQANITALAHKVFRSELGNVLLKVLKREDLVRRLGSPVDFSAEHKL